MSDDPSKDRNWRNQQRQLGEKGHQTGNIYNQQGYDKYEKEQERKKQEERDRYNREQQRLQDARIEQIKKEKRARAKQNKRRNNNIPRPTNNKRKKDSIPSWLIILIVIMIFGALGKNEDNEISTTTFESGLSTQYDGIGQVDSYDDYDENYEDNVGTSNVKFSLIDTDRDPVTFRSTPSISGNNKIGKIPKFEIVKLIEILGQEETINGMTSNWVKVGYKDKVGYVFGSFILHLDFEAKYGVVETEGLPGLRLRYDPEVNFGNKILTIPNQSIVKILKTGIKKDTIDNIIGEWIFVDYKSVEGHVFDGFIKEID